MKMNAGLGIVVAGLLMALVPRNGSAQQWIWSRPVGKAQGGEVVFFRKTFTVRDGLKEASLFATCDNGMVVFLNGHQVAKSNDWHSPAVVNVKGKLKDGVNVLAVRGENDAGNIAGLFLKLEMRTLKERSKAVGTDRSWRIAGKESGGWKGAGFDDSSWKRPTLLGKWGVGPWGRPAGGRAAASGGGSAAPVTITLPAGFKSEMIYRVPKGVQGSWVSLTRAGKGRLIASDQGGSLYRITPSAAGETKVEKIDLPIGRAQGLLWAFDSLYVHVSGSGSGFYRLRDTDGDDRLDKVEKLMEVRGGGEHGPHGVILSADGKSLFVEAGNHTDLPKTSGSRIPGKWSEDLLLPRQWDARGHARGKLAPGGWVCKVDREGRNWEVYSIGYRNEYDIAINRHGDMFTYDADMEWDMGMPWYRPTRVCHVVSGSEYGWRSGTGKWPTYYEDSLPPTLDVGPGSPTGVVFGTGAKFPTKYQDALYILDWTFGTIWAVHLTPKGASYAAVKEEFVTGSPLPVTDAVVGDDGAFYFTVGGRGTQSALHRVTYRGDASTAPPTDDDPAAAKARAVRRKLEAFHGRANGSAIETAWPYLGHEDRFIRYAARVAVESQPVTKWRGLALRENHPPAKVTALMSLARMGGQGVHGDLVKALLSVDPKRLNETQMLGLLRAYALCFIRTGKPEGDEAQKVVDRLDPLLPAESDRVSTELVRVLVYLDAPKVVEKTLKLMSGLKPEPIPDWGRVITRNGGYGGTIRRMLDNYPPLRKIQYAFLLRNVRYGWTMEQRKAYFGFIKEAGGHAGGASYSGFLTNMRNDALKNCSPAERLELRTLTGEKLAPLAGFNVTPPKGPGKEWTVGSALEAKGGGLKGRSFENGRNVFHAVGCVKCHRFDGMGGAVGPDVSSVRSKFTHRDLLEAILEPSKVVSDQYAATNVALKDGRVVTGLMVELAEGAAKGDVLIYTSDPNAAPVRVKRSEIKATKKSSVSQMPAKLLDVLNRQEMLDLLAYLMSRGDPGDAMFGK